MRERFCRFMQGRYGQDEFSRFLLGAVLVCIILNIFLRSSALNAVTWLLLLYAYFRILSRNHAARCGENQRYLKVLGRASRQLQAPVGSSLTSLGAFRDDLPYRYKS